MSKPNELHRNVLPIPAKPRTGLITYDAKDPDSSYPPIEQLRPPKDAPNILVILIDDAVSAHPARSADRARPPTPSAWRRGG